MKAGKDYIGVGVGGAICDDKGRFFLAKRGEKAKNEAGKWEFPGGEVYFGETLEQALIREIEEEFGFVVKTNKLIGISDHILVEEKQHWVSPSFICQVIDGEPTIKEPEKCSKIGWFGIDEIDQLDLTIPTKHDIDIIKKKYPNGLT